jgi:hypothetical protein
MPRAKSRLREHLGSHCLWSPLLLSSCQSVPPVTLSVRHVGDRRLVRHLGLEASSGSEAVKAAQPNHVAKPDLNPWRSRARAQR